MIRLFLIGSLRPLAEASRSRMTRELAPENWEPALEDLAAKLPEIVGRFTAE